MEDSTDVNLDAGELHHFMAMLNAEIRRESIRKPMDNVPRGLHKDRVMRLLATLQKLHEATCRIDFIWRIGVQSKDQQQKWVDDIRESAMIYISWDEDENK